MTGDDAERLIETFRDRWSVAFRARDFEKIVVLYDDAALFFGSAPELCVGRKAIRDYFHRLPAGIELNDFPVPEVRAVAPNVIVASGFWSFTLDERTLPYRLAWTLVDFAGEWRIVQHHAAARPETAL